MKTPPHAAQVWTSGDTLWLGLPSITGHPGHAVPLPNTAAGLAQLQRILEAREKSTLNCRIGEAGSPTRAQLEAIAQKRAAARERHAEKIEAKLAKQAERKREAQSAEALLAELGL